RRGNRRRHRRVRRAPLEDPAAGRAARRAPRCAGRRRAGGGYGLMPMAEGARQVEFGTTGFYPAFTGADMTREAEEMGFDIQCFSENHSRVPDCFGEMRDAARTTDRIALMCGPVNFLTRDPGVVASSLLPVQVISGGRAICGIASGDSAASAAGRRPQRIAAMARAIALAARLADRIYLGIGTNPERMAWALRIIDDAAAEAGSDRGELRVGAFAPLAITRDRPSGRASIRTRVAAWAHMCSGRGTDLSQQPEILRRVTSVLRDGYDYSFHHPGAQIGR